jgi:hypothetical protein
MPPFSHGPLTGTVRVSILLALPISARPFRLSAAALLGALPFLLVGPGLRAARFGATRPFGARPSFNLTPTRGVHFTAWRRTTGTSAVRRASRARRVRPAGLSATWMTALSTLGALC